MSQEEQQRAKQGVLLAIGAYTMWGIAPIYFKALGSVSPLEILSHRVDLVVCTADAIAAFWPPLAQCS